MPCQSDNVPHYPLLVASAPDDVALPPLHAAAAAEGDAVDSVATAPVEKSLDATRCKRRGSMQP